MQVRGAGPSAAREAVEFAAECGTGTIHLPGGGGPYLLSTTLPIAVGATTDQRGVARPIGGRCDAGAYEAPLSVRPGGSKPSLGSPRSKLKKKRLRLTYAVSGPGKLVVRLFMKGHKRVGGATARPAKAGDVTVRIKLARRALRALKAKAGRGSRPGRSSRRPATCRSRNPSD